MKNEIIQNRVEWFATQDGKMLNIDIETAAMQSGIDAEIINSCFEEHLVWVKFTGQIDLYIQLMRDKYEEIVK